MFTLHIKSVIKLLITVLCLFGFPVLSVASSPPILRFSDLISGPDTGVNDGKGSGVIVTVWGQGLRSKQYDSNIEYCDSTSTCRPGHVYYWKNADGQLPGGPANLFDSLQMQEIAFSIPDSAQGTGSIKITTDSGTSTLPFTVRTGNIYHVMSNGNDSSGDGSFSNPWLTVAKADGQINAGSTLYIHNIVTGDENTVQVIYNNRKEAMSTLAAQFAYVAYPNTRPQIIGERGFTTYAGGTDNTVGFVVSKFSIYAANADEDVNGQPINIRSTVTVGIEGSKDGRAIGNFITDAHPSDTSGACPEGQQGAINAHAQFSDKVSNYKIFGNHIKDYGCKGTTRFQHTTYITIRSADNNRQLVAPELAWNYLQDNLAIDGLHYYDENLKGTECGQYTTTFKIHDNFIINQGGAAIRYGAVCPVNTTFDIYQNIAINVGLKADYDSSTINGSIFSAILITANEGATSTINIHDNTFYKWNEDNPNGSVNSCIGLSSRSNEVSIIYNNNTCWTDGDKPFIASSFQGNLLESKFTGSGNSWFSSVTNPTQAIAPIWDTNKILTAPSITFSGSRLLVDKKSPLASKSATTLTRDIYGVQRLNPPTVGAVSTGISPKTPENLSVQ